MGNRETRAKKVRCTLLPSFVFCKRNLTCRFLFAMISGLRDLCARKFPIPFHAKADGESARRIIFSSVLSRRQSFPTSFSLLLSRSRCASAWCPPCSAGGRGRGMMRHQSTIKQQTQCPWSQRVRTICIFRCSFWFCAERGAGDKVQLRRTQTATFLREPCSGGPRNAGANRAERGGKGNQTYVGR